MKHIICYDKVKSQIIQNSAQRKHAWATLSHKRKHATCFRN